MAPENRSALLSAIPVKDEPKYGKKVNGVLDAAKRNRRGVNLKRRAKREIAKKEDPDTSSEDEEEPAVRTRKTRSNTSLPLSAAIGDRGAALANTVKKERPEKATAPAAEKVKPEMAENAIIKKEPGSSSNSAAAAAPPNNKRISMPYPTTELKIEIKEETVDVPEIGRRDLKKEVSASPSSAASSKSPTKPSLGLPDQTGLIVGVNTINYDVGLRNKSKTREEKKMEMIL